MFTMFWFLTSLFLLALLLQYDGVIADITEAENARSKTWLHKLVSVISLGWNKGKELNKNRLASKKAN